MNENLINFVKDQLALILSILPIVIMLERTIHFFGVNISMLFFNILLSLVGFFFVWIINAKISKVKDLFSSLGLCTCLISILLWIIWKEMVIIYLLGIALLILNAIYHHNTSNQDSIFQRQVIFRVESYICIGLSLSFFIAVYVWKNLFFFVMSGILCIFLILNLPGIKKKGKDVTGNVDKSIALTRGLKKLGRDVILVVLPFLLAGVLFISFYGYLIFIPVDFSRGKLIISLIFAILGFFFSLFNNSR
ncbi:MAG: hypothetical protein R6U96_11465 [Promethearchaeia archaeon]